MSITIFDHDKSCSPVEQSPHGCSQACLSEQFLSKEVTQSVRKPQETGHCAKIGWYSKHGSHDFLKRSVPGGYLLRGLIVGKNLSAALGSGALIGYFFCRERNAMNPLIYCRDSTLGFHWHSGSTEKRKLASLRCHHIFQGI